MYVKLRKQTRNGDVTSALTAEGTAGREIKYLVHTQSRGKRVFSLVCRSCFADGHGCEQGLRSGFAAYTDSWLRFPALVQRQKVAFHTN